MDNSVECLSDLFNEDKDKGESTSSDGLRTNNLELTPTAVVVRVYHLGRIISRVFQEENLHYWTSGGTTLGAVRHNGLIPWDDDLDLCILKDNTHQFTASVVPKLENEHGVICQETCFGYRLFHRTNSEPSKDNGYATHRYPFCDVFVMRRQEVSHKQSNCDSLLVECASATARCLYPKEIYPYEDIADPSQAKFGDFYLSVPRNSHSYLDNYYGEDWREIGTTQNYCHLSREKLRPVSFDLGSQTADSETFLPALPFR